MTQNAVAVILHSLQLHRKAAMTLFVIQLTKLFANVTCCSSGHRVNDGLWHSVSLDTRNLQATLTVDSEPSSTIELWEQLESRGNFYFGGWWSLAACVHTL